MLPYEKFATEPPPVVEYSRELQARAAEELAMLPDGSAIVEMMADYAVMREAGAWVPLGAQLLLFRLLNTYPPTVKDH